MNGNNKNNDQNRRSPRPPMTPEQKRDYEERKRAYMERRRAEREAEERRRTEKRRRIVLAVIAVAVFALLIALSAILISGFLSDADPSTPKTFTFKINDEREKVAYNDVNRGGVLCIDLRSLKDILMLTESSSRTDAVTFTARSSGSRVVFTDKSNIAAVNGLNIAMPAVAIVSNEVCSVPIETVAYIFTGINVSVAKSSVTITRNDEQIDILAKSTDPLNMIIEFKADLDKYEEYMNPQGEMRDSFLLLVNKQNPLGASYIPQNLVTLSDKYCINQNANQLNKYAAEALSAMLTELWAQTNATYIISTSGYRSYSYQLDVFEKYVKQEMEENKYSQKEAEQAVLQYSAQAGYSEHQSGLCIDLIDTCYNDLENFEHTGGYFTDKETYEWLKNNAWKFGFVLRYPSDKEDVTGYNYESWHYRYVGRYHAEKMYRSGQTLDEYVASLG